MTTIIIYVLIGTRKVLYWVVNFFRREVVPLIRRGGQITPALGWSTEIGLKGSLCSVFPPGTRTVRNKEAEKSTHKKAFYNFIGWHTLHQPTLRNVIEKESQNSTHPNGNHCGFKTRSANGTLHPTSVGL